MVNFVTHHQYVAGLYVPSAPGPQPGEGSGQVSRIMSLDHGFCPHVVDRKTLILNDVCAHPRFAGNPVIDEIGVRTYVGAPLIDDHTGMALGTICVVDTAVRPWGHPGLEFI